MSSKKIEKPKEFPTRLGLDLRGIAQSVRALPLFGASHVSHRGSWPVSDHSDFYPLRSIRFTSFARSVALAIGVCAFLMTVAASLAATDDSGAAAPRRVIALYDGGLEVAPRWTRLHRFIELPLNHLGYQLDYYNLRSGLPPAVVDADVAAVITWFDAPPPDVTAFQKWASNVRRTGADPDGLKIIALGVPAVSESSQTASEAKAYLARLGIERMDQPQRFGIWSRVAIQDPEMIGFERDFTIVPGDQWVTVARGGDAVSHLRIVSRPEEGAATDLAITSSDGAYVNAAALVREDESGLRRWILDPFAFFERVLEPTLRPVPDATTLSGRRIFLSTINGEGWNTPVSSDTLTEAPVLAGAIILDQFIVPYPDIPASLALVSGELDPALSGASAETGVAIARSALSQPQIDAASLTRTLPTRWAFFENYRRDAELAIVGRVSRAPRTLERGLVPEAVSTLGSAFVADETIAMARSSEAPRRFMLQPFDLDAEIGGSLSEMSALSPQDSPAALMVWSGDAELFEAALRSSREAGAEGIGGGGGILDATAPSLTNLWPLSVQVGNERQVYDPLSNDAAFTNFWSTPSYGFFRFTKTLDATDKPRRLKPYHLSFSAYSALQFGPRNAVLFHLERARTAAVTPVKSFHFARIARGFATTRVIALGDQRWRIEDRGALQTVRFDHALGYGLDMERSEGVIGMHRQGETLYIALDASHDRPIVAIKASEAPSGGFSLDNSRWMIDQLEQTICSATFRAAGYGPGEMTWRMPKSGDYRIEVFEEDESKPVYWDDLPVANDLILTTALPPIAVRPVRIAISGC